MCATCGCGGNEGEDAHRHGDEHGRGHGHVHGHHTLEPGRILKLEKEILAKNDAYAQENREWLAKRGVVAFNLVSAPGSGKTTLLEATLRSLAGRVALSVIEGDQETERDAQRIRAAGGRALQLNTGTGCHLDAHAVGHALEDLDPPRGSIVIIENVGNLVCPALFDLGERAKVTTLSVTEGEDKPLKYPHMFRVSSVLVLNKVDLLPHLRFDVDRCLANARSVNPKQDVFRLSATTGQGMPEWCSWLMEQVRSVATR